MGSFSTEASIHNLKYCKHTFHETLEFICKSLKKSVQQNNLKLNNSNLKSTKSKGCGFVLIVFESQIHTMYMQVT